MNILILGNKDIASNFAINLLLPYLSKHKIHLFLSSRVGGNKKLAPSLKRLKFFEQDIFFNLLFSYLKSPAERPYKLRSFDQMRDLLFEPAKELNKINFPEGVELVQGVSPDLIISIRYGNILKDKVIQSSKLGVLNLHSGILPDYQGVMATFWAMLNREKEIGTTLHYIRDQGIDTGDVVANFKMKPDYNKSYLINVLSLYQSGITLVEEAVSTLENGKKLKSTNQTSEGKYYSFPTEQDFQRFKELGFNLVNEEELIAFVKSHY